jgi:hypothetical protein
MGGLVAMHHLTAIGCSIAMNDHASAHVMDEQLLPADAARADAAKEVTDIPAPDIVCIALIASAAILHAGRKFWLVRRRENVSVETMRGAEQWSGLPPDLHVLSISRT